MMKYLRYIFILVLACISFMIIDNVYAATGLYIPNTGTYEQIMYSNGDILTSSTSTSDPSTTVFSGKGYFRLGYPVNNGSYRITYSYRFIWYTSGSYFKDYDSFGFTLGYQPGYVNNLSILMLTDGWESGWIQCTPISLPGTGNDYGTQFSAFSCPYKSSEIDPSKSYTLHAIANSISAYADQNTSQGAPLLYNPTFYFSSDVLLYKNSEDKVVDALKEQTEALNGLNDSINNSDTSDADSSSSSFFEGFEDEDYGLSDIITMPLSMIKNITSATCSPLTFPLPFVNKNATLPCMTEIYSQFGPILNIYQTITFGIIAYWVCVNIFATVKSFKDPDRDEIEVVDL